MFLLTAASRNILLVATSQFYAEKTVWILIAYVAIGCFAVAAPLLRVITGHSYAELRFLIDAKSYYGLSSLTDFRLSDGWVLFGLDILYPAAKYITVIKNNLYWFLFESILE